MANSKVGRLRNSGIPKRLKDRIFWGTERTKFDGEEDGVALAFEAIDAWPNIVLVLISADAAGTFDSYSKRAGCLWKPFGHDELFRRH